MEPTLQAQHDRLDAVFALRHVATPSGQVAYRECGQGAQTVVLLHGIGSASASWLDVATGLGGVRVLAWDAPGYGGSAGLPQPAPMASDYARVLAQFLRALQVERCTLVGHSLGALMAVAAVGTDARSRVESLVLISPARGYGADPVAAQRTRTERLDTLERLGVPGMARERSARLLSPAASEQQRQWVHWNMAQLRPDGYRAAVHMLCSEDIARHDTAALPVQVWCGAEDQITTPAACAEVARRFGTHCQPIADAGHASPVQAPLAVAALLSAALRTGVSEVPA